MLEFFVIFSKSGIFLFGTVNQASNDIINGLIKNVFLEERTGQYQTDQLQIKYIMDNEFELLFVVGYQKFLQLCYVDKFLDKMKLAFRDKYVDFDLRRILNISFNKQTQKLLASKQNQPTGIYSETFPNGSINKQKRLDFCNLIIDDGINILDLTVEFSNIYQDCVKNNGTKKLDTMRTFHDSAKSKKTIASMIVDQNKECLAASKLVNSNISDESVTKPGAGPKTLNNKVMPRQMAGKLANKNKRESTNKKKGKAARQWDLCGSNPEEFDFSKKSTDPSINTSFIQNNISALKDGEMEMDLIMTDNDEEEEENEEVNENEVVDTGSNSYFTSIWKSISYNKVLTETDLAPVLDQLREHLTRKNVAAQIADEISVSIGEKLKGSQVNTWVNLKKFARDALEEAILRILNPTKNINILREVQSKSKPPYVIVLCGVNGVGKSTNLAKIANWLIINNVKVLIVAGDTFRAGAIEQLRTHVRALKAIHERPKGSETKIELFEKGYNRDTDNIAREAINYARLNGFNCVIVDTAGRMQDNEPLMKQLAKLIKNNNPDLTLFVGEALVGNEAVDQLTKFNSSLIDNGCQLTDSNKSAINGIVLTKFDTIDDQVGAAISMTYVTGKPIVFVGVGQTYRDLKQLDAKAVTKALMR